MFSRENSGTYNNQMQVVDFSRFSVGSHQLPDDLLVIVEQMPGATYTAVYLTCSLGFFGQRLRTSALDRMSLTIFGTRDILHHTTCMFTIFVAFECG